MCGTHVDCVWIACLPHTQSHVFSKLNFHGWLFFFLFICKLTIHTSFRDRMLDPPFFVILESRLFGPAALCTPHHTPYSPPSSPYTSHYYSLSLPLTLSLQLKPLSIPITINITKCIFIACFAFSVSSFCFVIHLLSVFQFCHHICNALKETQWFPNIQLVK